ncbi:hypothetical protein R3P38DRAFT_2762302 [Favolaschia claudopus]|uniref:Uncharacterized protein n=1 Tax=Favolaschia claudopus TaxID=2862362 RepID=A0AAW0DL71_9AGAR
MALSIWIDVPRAGERDFPHRSQHCSVVAVVVVDAPRSGAITLTRRIVVRRATLQNYFRILKFTAILLDVEFNFSAARPSPTQSNIKIRFLRVRRATLPHLPLHCVDTFIFIGLSLTQAFQIFFFPLRGALHRHQYQAQKSKFQISRSRERGVELLDLQSQSVRLELIFFRCAAPSSMRETCHLQVCQFFCGAKLRCYLQCKTLTLISNLRRVSVRIRTLETRVFRPFQGSKKSKNFPAGAG